ncbi:MAG: anthranilate phosphoribosyltransferase [Acidimicrobiales bacterium]
MVAALADAGGWPAILGPLTSRRDLTADQAEAAMAVILAGQATSAQIAGFIVALRMKGETTDELRGLLAAMRAAGEGVPVAPAGLVDVVGTGGDRSHSINVSTLSALVVAGAGGRVCKHGNRAASSACGSADVLDALGVTIELAPEGVARCIAEAGIGFCFAPRFHPAMRHAAPTRRELGVPTVFNSLGPMANPAGVRRQVLGVADWSLADRMIKVLAALGSERVLIVHGHDGLDELTTTTSSSVLELRDGEIRGYEVDPAALGLKPSSSADLRGSDAATNADHARRVLGGERGAHRDIVVLNAGAGMVAAGLADDIAGGMELAVTAIDDGRAADALERLVASSRAAHALSAR